jgi:hypothetical protein
MKRYSNPVYQGVRLQQLVELLASEAKGPFRSVTPLPPIQRVDRRLSAETIAELVQAYRDGAGTPTLRRRYKLSQGSVLKLLREHEVVMRPNGTNRHGPK